MITYSYNYVYTAQTIYIVYSIYNILQYIHVYIIHISMQILKVRYNIAFV